MAVSSDDMKVRVGSIGFIRCKYVRLYCALIALAKSDAIKRLLITTLLLCDAMRYDYVGCSLGCVDTATGA